MKVPTVKPNSNEVCEFCGDGWRLCDCCASCNFALSLHCGNCDNCACQGC
jgi:hypothetical protein